LNGINKPTTQEMNYQHSPCRAVQPACATFGATTSSQLLHVPLYSCAPLSFRPRHESASHPHDPCSEGHICTVLNASSLPYRIIVWLPAPPPVVSALPNPPSWIATRSETTIRKTLNARDNPTARVNFLRQMVSSLD
jgi:hypothetical protein